MIELRRVKTEAIVPLTDEFVTNRRLRSDWTQYTEPLEGTVDLELVQALTRKAAAMLPVEEMDPWLAPRLHNAIRIPRRLAAEGGMWAWLALQCPEFIEARFAKAEGRVHPWRYRDTWSRNGLARLWWGAEMVRNGPSYADVPLCFARVRTAQFALELMYSWSRPAAIALVRVAEGWGTGKKLSDTQVKGLSTRLRVYLSLRSLELSQVGRQEPEEFDAEWASHRPTLASLTVARVEDLVGPANGFCDEAAIEELCGWYREIVEEEWEPTAPSS